MSNTITTARKIKTATAELFSHPEIKTAAWIGWGVLSLATGAWVGCVLAGYGIMSAYEG